MAQDDTTEWLTERGRKKDLTVELARQHAVEARLGWYVAPHGHGRYIIGKMTMHKLSSRHIVVDDEGNPLTFATIEEAKAFLRDEIDIHSPQVFDY